MSDEKHEQALDAVRTMLRIQQASSTAATQAEARADIAVESVHQMRDRVVALETDVKDIKASQGQILLKLGQLTERTPLERVLVAWFLLAAGSWFTLELLKALLKGPLQ